MDSIMNFTALALILPIILFMITGGRKKVRPVSAKWPPGPKTLPIIGHMHLLKPQVFRSFADLSKQYGPLMHLKLGEVDAVVVSSREAACEMLKQHDPCYAGRPESISFKILWYNYRDIVFSPYGDYWRQMRKICTIELLSARSVRSFASIRGNEVSRLVASIRASASAGKAVSLGDMIFSTMSSVTCRAAFGEVLKDENTLIGILKEGMRLSGGFEVADFFPSSFVMNTFSWTKMRLLMLRRKLDPILDELIKQHRANLGRIRKEKGGETGRKGNGVFGNEDIVDVLLRLQETGDLQFPIGNDDIKAVIHDMFTAGTETTSTTIDWAMTELMRNPKAMANAQEEVRRVFDDTTILTMGDNDHHNLKYLKMVIKETLRLHPAIPIIRRESLEERVIHGYIIPAKVKILVNNWGMQRDPKYWTNPESFEPERFEECSKEFLGADFDFLPFGAGKRMCPGITFAMASVELVLAHLLYHFDWKLPNGIEPESFDMIENPGLSASRRESLLLVPVA